MLLLEDKIAKIVNHISHIPDEFGGDRDNDDYSSALDSIYWNMRDIDTDIIVNHGISKAVIIPPDCNYVVKLPFNGFYETYTDEMTLETIERWYPFENANLFIDTDEGDNYCETELVIYNMAKEKGFEKFFTETHFYGYVDCTPVYIQEKAIPLSDDSSYSSRKTSKNAQEIVEKKNWQRIVNRKWAELAVDYYGEEQIEKFFDFFQDMGVLEDLHNGNIGFGLFDNRPLILDFSDYSD
jgi:hypothetical protein